MFVHLRLHTEFSVVDGTTRIDDIVKAAARDGQPALAITDLNNLFGAKFKLISGYRDGSSITLAFERGEVQAICQTYSSVKIAKPAWFAKDEVNPILTMGLALFIAWLKTVSYLGRDDHRFPLLRKTHEEREDYESAARFWAKIFAVNFAVGVVTGIPLEFQFGTN